MTACCTPSGTTADDCPACRQPGVPVGADPVRAHLPGAQKGRWHHCRSTACPVVFFLGDEQLIDRDVTAQVGTKATSKPTPVCFCFAHTRQGIVDDVAAHDGASSIEAEIRSAVRDGHCSCEHLNPTRRCCLGEVHAIVRAASPAPR